MNNFRKPNDGWLCFLSLMWIVLSVIFVVRFALAGKFFGSGIMAVFGLAAAGLWFQSRVAAWMLILFAGVGIIHGLFSIGHIPLVRLLGRFCFAGYSIFLLIEYLKDADDS